MARKAAKTTKPSDSRAKMKSEADSAYRDGRLVDARDLYLKLINLEETPILRSNLSATHYELGEYEDSIRNSQSVISLLDSSETTRSSTTLRMKNELRLARSCITLGRVHDASNTLKRLLADPNTDERTKSTCLSLLEATSHIINLAMDDKHLAEARLAFAPRYRPMVSRSVEYYTVGGGDLVSYTSVPSFV